ncbi:MAG: hypothetical protein QGG36_01825 [Pirellulaceae bacterium]|jgi:hypothetical protein|nr:hypothetical protein [Pirellulaceae bacterium]
MRIISTAIIVLAGSICMAGAAAGGGMSFARDASQTGAILLFVGGAGFLFEYLVAWRDALAARRPHPIESVLEENRAARTN